MTGQETSRQPNLAIVTCIKNEGEDLVEWLCFHRIVGVNRFIIYDNLSTDATRRILNSVPFQEQITVRRISRSFPQKAAYLDALRRYRHSLEWVAFIDGDEFLVPLGDRSLPQHLGTLGSRAVNGFGMHWRIFGSSGHKTRPVGLLSESFTHRARDIFKANWHIKSVVRIKEVKTMVTPHYFRVGGTFLMDDESEPPPDFDGLADHSSYNQGFAIYHYITKSHEQCLRKIARGRPRPESRGRFRPPTYLRLYDRNEVEDDRTAQLIAPIREEVIGLRDAIGRD